MSGKDENIYSKESLMSTSSGKEIIKQALVHGKGYKQFNRYKDIAEKDFVGFAGRFFQAMNEKISNDKNPSLKLERFANELNSDSLMLESSKIHTVYERISDKDVLFDRITRILNSNFVKMTLPVFNALYDGASQYYKDDSRFNSQIKENLIDGHIIAIDLSEPMDRIVDRDEDLEYLDDYKLMNPYILEIAREKISSAGEEVMDSFEKGFIEARQGQELDIKLKMNEELIDSENMNTCYKKYRSIMGTAGKNMALNIKPLSSIYEMGMSKAGESVGCGNEIEDSIKNGYIKVPSWPLYFAVNTGNIKKGFELTLQKSDIYLQEARLALEMLPEKYELGHFLEFLFLSVRHYNQYWFKEVNKTGTIEQFSSKMKTGTISNR